MDQEDQKWDNLFVFGKEYVAVVDGRVSVGEVSMVKEMVVCVFNKDFKGRGLEGKVLNGTQMA